MKRPTAAPRVLWSLACRAASRAECSPSRFFTIACGYEQFQTKRGKRYRKNINFEYSGVRKYLLSRMCTHGGEQWTVSRPPCCRCPRVWAGDLQMDSALSPHHTYCQHLSPTPAEELYRASSVNNYHHLLCNPAMIIFS